MNEAVTIAVRSLRVALTAILLVGIVSMHGVSGAAPADRHVVAASTDAGTPAPRIGGSSAGHALAHLAVIRSADARCDAHDDIGHLPMHACAVSPCSMATAAGGATPTIPAGPARAEGFAADAAARVRLAWVALPPARPPSPQLLSISRT